MYYGLHPFNINDLYIKIVMFMTMVLNIDITPMSQWHIVTCMQKDFIVQIFKFEINVLIRLENQSNSYSLKL